MKDRYPIKFTEFGNHLRVNVRTLKYAGAEIIEECKSLLLANYDELKDTVEVKEENVSLTLSPPKVFTRISDDVFPFTGTKYVCFSCSAVGRAFIVDRLPKLKMPFKRHKNKNNVPKRKRGKKILNYRLADKLGG